MNEIIDMAIEKAKMGDKKIRTKKVPMDLFENQNNKLFDFSKDYFTRFKKIPARPLDLSKWKDNDFINFMRESLGKCHITSGPFDKMQITRLKDRITINLEVITRETNSKCDNQMLKRYLDWWLSIYRDKFQKENILVRSEHFCGESSVMEFFSLSAWKATEPSQTLAIKIKNTTPTPKSLVEMYKSGGIKKLLYEVGVIDSCDFLVRVKSKSIKESFTEIRKGLNGLHDAVFQYVVDKTIKHAPYECEKAIDFKKLIDPVLKRRQVNIEMRIDSLFFKEK